MYSYKRLAPCNIFYSTKADLTQGSLALLDEALPSIKALFPRRHFWFQQDGAPCHTSRASTDFIKEKFPHHIPKQDWPPNSPDLSPIENLWDIIDKKVKARKASSMSELKDFVMEEWEQIETQLLRNLLGSMTERFQACIDCEGEWTDY